MIRVVALLALLAGCPPKLPPPPEGPVETDPVKLLERATAEAPPGPSSVTFDLKVDMPDQHISAQGALVVSPPDRFRVEVRGPIGPPVLIIASDGESLRAWLAQKNTLLVSPDADARIRVYTGGEAGLSALASLLVGRLPALGTPDDMGTTTPTYRWSGPEQSRLDAALDPRSAHLAALSLVGEAGVVLLDASVEGRAWPQRLVARVPSKGLVAMLSFDEWKPAAPPDAAFVLTAPEGSTVAPLELVGAGADGP